MAKKKSELHHRVYVILLDPKVLKKSPQFKKKNPDYDPDGGKPCVYVGETGEPIRLRFAKHLLGIKAGKRFVTKYGLGLMPELYKKYEPMTWEEAVKREKELADELREQGYAVWQG